MTDRITSVHNPRIRLAARLRDRSGREQQQRFLIDGAREIDRALQAGITIEELFVCESSLRPASRAVLQRALELGLRPVHVSSAVQSRLAFGERDDGLVACARTPLRTFDDLSLPDNAVVAVLAGIEKPGNVGAVIRSADAAGIAAVLIADGGTDLYNPNAIRASLGTIFSVPLATGTTARLRQWLHDQRFHIFATRVGVTQQYFDVSYSGRVAFILGSESQGLDDTWSGSEITPISLPMRGVADSLNVSVTAGVLFYETLRQRCQSPTRN